MKKIITLILVTLLLLQAITTFAANNNAGFEGGIHKNELDYKNEKQYQEVIFITGKPIVVYGTVKITIKDDKISYVYKKLSSKDKTVTLDRTVELERKIDDTSVERQVVEVNNITKFTEKITAGSDSFKLTEYVFHNSTINDEQPVVDYYTGNWQGYKIYTKNDGDKKVEVNITGDIYGYTQNWGATETQKINHFIKQIDVLTDKTDWTGYADIDVSFNKTKRMKYFDNMPYQSSFEGGYTLTEKEETIMDYNYNLPYIESSAAPSNIRNIGSGVEKYETLPTQKKMFIPKYQDIKGRWSEWDIKRLAGLQVIDGTNKFFGPKLVSKRVDFAKWVVKSMELVNEDTPKRSYTKPELTPPLFNDITIENPDYKYIKAIKDKGIMQGAPNNKFLPDGNLTRAQAITIVIRALGLERLAPNPPFNTRFLDDKDIPEYSKRYIYVADLIGLAKGTPEGYIYPNENMTKEEAAAFINRLINYLQDDIKEEYRENIINYK